MSAAPVNTIVPVGETRPVRAFVETALAGSNNNLRMEWLLPGTVGNGKTLQGTFSGSYPVVAVALVGSAPVTGVAITGPASATAKQVRAAWNANPAVEALASINFKLGSDGTGIMATFGPLNLAGGSGTAPDAPVSTLDG